MQDKQWCGKALEASSMCVCVYALQSFISNIQSPYPTCFGLNFKENSAFINIFARFDH